MSLLTQQYAKRAKGPALHVCLASVVYRDSMAHGDVGTYAMLVTGIALYPATTDVERLVSEPGEAARV